MSEPFARAIVSPIMVGREPHLAALRRCLDEALAGAGQTVLVAGEAGIGKSRLVKEAAAHAREHGMRILTGQCFESDHALPYAPWRDLIRSHLLRQPWAAAILAEIAPDLGDLVPELTRLVSGVTAEAHAGADQDRRRFFDALTRLVDEISAESPLLLIIEDAHWSDEASLDLLLHLARFVRGGTSRPIMLIVTFRSEENLPALVSALAALDRDRLAAETRLGPLPRAEVMVMLRAMSDRHRAVSADLADAIYRLSEGNPFFVEELLRSVLAMDGRGLGQTDEQAGVALVTIPLPRSIAEAVGRRVRRLSDGARETLTLAAISGRHFDFALLQALSGCDDERLLERIKELVAAKLVVEESADRFAFRHALMCQAITDGLLVRERQALHRRVLDALLRADPGARDHQAADLARHAAAAGAWAEAIEFGRRAGEQALALFAPRAAVELLSLAIDAVGLLDLAPDSALLRSRGQAHETVGDFEAARDDFETAAALARAAGRMEDESEALLALGSLWAARDYAKTGAYVRQALDLARGGSDRSLLARALNRLGNWYVNVEEPAEAFRFHEEALAHCEAIGDRPGIAETLDLLALVHHHAGDYVGCVAVGRRAIPLLRELNDRPTLLNTLARLAVAMGTLDINTVVPATATDEERRAVLGETLGIARAIESLPGEAFAHCCAAIALGEHQIAEALDHGRRALRIAEEIGHRQWAIFAHDTLGTLFAALLDLDTARRHLDAALAIAQEVGSSFWTRIALTDIAKLKVQEGDLDGAEQAIAQALDEDAPMRTLNQREVWFARAEVALSRGRSERALEIVDRLIAVATDDAGRDLIRLPNLARLRGEALMASGRPDAAIVALETARDGAMARGNLPLLWRIHLARAALFRGLDRRGGVDREIAAAHATVASIAAGLPDVELREAFLHRATTRLPPLRVPSSRQAAKAAYGGLTEREREVAALIAAGQSNREVGDALFMSERTAATHVGNILGKLGLRTRAQIAAWAQERSLTADRAR